MSHHSLLIVVTGPVGYIPLKSLYLSDASLTRCPDKWVWRAEVSLQWQQEPLLT